MHLDFLDRCLILSPLDQADGVHAVRLVDVRLAAGNRLMIASPQTPAPLALSCPRGASGLSVNLKIHGSLLAIG